MAGKLLKDLTAASGGELVAGSLLWGSAVAGVEARKYTITQVGAILSYQPLDTTLTALAAANWAADALPIGTGADTLSQTTFAANTFPAKASTGALVAKAITDAALTVLDDTTTAAMLTTLGAAARVLVITTDANANHDLILTDAAPLAYLRMTNAGANTVTIPLNATIAFPVGAQISGIQAGAGATTIVATGGVTLNCAHTLVARAQYSAWSLIKVATDTWDLMGDLA